MLFSRKLKILAAAGLAVLLVIVIILVLYFTVWRDDEDGGKRRARGIVVTNGYECSKIGGEILERGGSAVDAAIAALFCEGVAMPAACGLGGGFLMTLYKRDTREVRFLNARETAPARATEDMFSDEETAQKGSLSVAVPGELRGYWALHQQYGTIPWSELIQPTIDLCLNGIHVTNYLETMMAGKLDLLMKDEEMRNVYINPITNTTYKEGDKIKRPKLAETLRIIASEGADALYTGSLVKNFVEDIGGIIEETDMNNYRPEWKDPVNVTLPSGETLYTAPIPGSGIVLAFILNLLNGFITTDLESVTNWQRIVESMKFAYGKRTHLGDSETVVEIIQNMTSQEHVEDIRRLIKDGETNQDPVFYGADYYNVEDHGTAHISVLAPNGDAVSVTSTINLVFGAGFMSPSTGIILNDEMDDFSSPSLNSSYGIPPSPANFIKPGRRPLSSMCPSIIVDKSGNVRLVTGAAGGTKITTSVALVILKHLYYGEDLKKAMDDPRLHHQLFPMAVQMEEAFAKNTKLVDGLTKIGHEVQFSTPNGFSAMTSISNQDGILSGASDFRRPGSVYYIY